MATGLRSNSQGITTRQINQPATGPAPDSSGPTGTVPLSNLTGAADLKAIEALAGTSGFLRKTAADTWALVPLYYDAANDRFAIGDEEFTMTIGGSSFPSKFSVHAEGGEAVIEAHVHDTGGGILSGPAIYGARSNGSEASETIVLDDDFLLSVAAVGFDGTDYEQAARIDFRVDGTPGAGDMPGRIVLLTSPDGSATPAERARFDALGLSLASGSRLGIGTPADSAIDLLGIGDQLWTDDATYLSWVGNSGESSSVFKAQIDGGSAKQSLLATGQAQWIGSRCAGTLGSPTALGASQSIASFLSAAYDGTTFQYNGTIGFVTSGAQSGTNRGTSLRFNSVIEGTTSLSEKMRVSGSGNLLVGVTADPSDTPGSIRCAGALRTGTPSGGTQDEWRLGTVSATSPTSPNRTIEVDVAGTIYYIHAKTTND